MIYCSPLIFPGNHELSFFPVKMPEGFLLKAGHVWIQDRAGLL